MRNWEFNLEAYQKFNIYQLNEIRDGLENGIKEEPEIEI